MGDHVWTVGEAKSKLSEILRRAREDGPQQIGKRESYVVVTAAEWARVSAPDPHLGSWLMENMPTLDDGLELPARADRDRSPPFDDEAP